MAIFDQGAHEVEIGLRGRRKRCLDFLDANTDQGFPEAQLLGRIHGLDQRLVAIAQVGTAPDRRNGNGLGRPGTVRQVDGGERAVFFRRIFEHGHGSNPFVCGL
ncbi:hypothetical protein D3C75_1160420 [compost metagenome]